jgi:hypothetical protein
MSDWKIVNGNLPFKDEFAELATGFDGYPESLWKIHNDGYLPFKVMFATRAHIDDAPDAIWRIEDGYLPRKVMFAELYEIDWYPPTTSWLQYAGYIPYRPWPGKIEIPNIIESVELPEIDWTRSMQQTFEYFTVDPRTWYDIERLDQITESSQTLDLTSEMRGNASISTTEPLGECYIRTYMRAKQDGVEHRICLGTFLYMTSSDSFDGKNHKYQMTGYTPLVELREALPPLGYFIYGRAKKGDNAPYITDEIKKAILENTRCDLEMNVTIPKPLLNNYVAGTDANWLSVVNDLLSAANDAKYMLTVDEWGSVQLKNSPTLNDMQPKFVYDDSNSSILLPDVDTTDDLFNIPNQVELIFTGSKEYSAYRFVATNDDEASPVSTVNRGRAIKKRYTMSNISIPTGLTPTDQSIRELVESQAYLLLESLSTVQKVITYSHGYCGTKVGDCVLINYERAGLNNVKAVITSQRTACKPGCQVDETATYTKSFYTRK